MALFAARHVATLRTQSTAATTTAATTTAKAAVPSSLTSSSPSSGDYLPSLLKSVTAAADIEIVAIPCVGTRWDRSRHDVS